MAENHLSLDIPRRPSSSTSSSDSPLNLSPTTSILTSTSPSSPNISAPPSLSVKFAPLPEVQKRKRRSNYPLGVAARSQLMRRRRAAIDGADPSIGYPEHSSTASGSPMWTDEEVQLSYHRRHHCPPPRMTVMGDEEPELVEDPLFTLGKIVKGASKSLWRKVSLRKGSMPLRSEKETEDGVVPDSGDVTDGVTNSIDFETGGGTDLVSQPGGEKEAAVEGSKRRSTEIPPTIPDMSSSVASLRRRSRDYEGQNSSRAI